MFQSRSEFSPTFDTQYLPDLGYSGFKTSAEAYRQCLTCRNCVSEHTGTGEIEEYVQNIDLILYLWEQNLIEFLPIQHPFVTQEWI